MIYIVGSVGLLMGLMFGYSWGVYYTIEKYKRYLLLIDELVVKADQEMQRIILKTEALSESKYEHKH